MMRRIATPGWFLVVSLSGALLDQGTWAVTDKKVSVSSSTAAYDQRESAIAMRAAESGLESGVLCSVWIDASVSTNQLRYGYSTDGGFNWNDGGALPAASSHIPLFDPDVAFRLLDKKFYITGIDRVTVSGGFTRGISIHSTDTCDPGSTFAHADVFLDPNKSIPDKPMMTINNWAGDAGNARDPNKYHDWIFVTSTINDATRSLAFWKWHDGDPDWVPAAASLVRPYPSNYSLGAGLQGPWPTTDPNGRVYVAWIRFQTTFGTGDIDIQVSSSTDGGQTFQMENSPLTGGRNPNTTGTNCSPGPVLKGDLNLVPSPQIEADQNGYLHMVYVVGDPNNSSDHSNVFYTRGTRGGDGTLSWSTSVRLNTDADSNADQFMPSLMVAKGTSKVAVYWYDRRAADPNASQPASQIYRSVSTDSGATWGSNVLVSDANSPSPGGSGGACDAMGHYNRGIADSANLYMLWSDRRTQGSSNHTNVFFERLNHSGVCTTSYCAGDGTRCTNTGSSDTCCSYQSVEDASCTGPDLVPPNACPCSVLE